MTRILGIAGLLILVTAVGCSTTKEPSTGPDPDSPMGREGDPGLNERPRGSSTTESNVNLRTIYFAFDDFSLRPDAKSTLQENAGALRSNPGARVEVQGNCDERGSTEYNLALGKKRAEAAKRYLVDLGIEPSRISTTSFGEENPAVRGSSESSWAKNRRDDFVVRR